MFAKNSSFHSLFNTPFNYPNDNPTPLGRLNALRCRVLFLRPKTKPCAFLVPENPLGALCRRPYLIARLVQLILGLNKYVM